MLGSIERYRKRQLQKVSAHLQTLGVPDDHEVYATIQVDLSVCSMGIVDYLQKQDQ